MYMFLIEREGQGTRPARYRTAAGGWTKNPRSARRYADWMGAWDEINTVPSLGAFHRVVWCVINGLDIHIARVDPKGALFCGHHWSNVFICDGVVKCSACDTVITPVIQLPVDADASAL